MRDVETEQERTIRLQQFAERYTFPLDTFQREAMEQILLGESVMVAAPTGTGKTLVAEFAIWLAQQRNQRVIYTTPLKALSNQKYRDLCALYGSDAVGLVTGDIVEHSRASIVIMTTEVYRNMLLEEGSNKKEPMSRANLQDVGFIVFDELHYLSDVNRGPVWEEAIICSPPHVRLVGLSATMSNAPDLADWISRVHRPISLITHDTRAVPLEHFYFLDGKLHLVQNENGERIERFPDIGGEAKLARRLGRGRTFPAEEKTDDLPEQLPSDSLDGAEESAAPKTPPKRIREAPKTGEVLTALRDANLLPCLYFLPGRRVVEEGALSATSHSFTTPEEERKIREEIDVWMESLSNEDRNLQQVHLLARLLPRGLAFHHAGLLPGLKVLVETFFARGYLRAVFATDTLALGVNMPARSVVVGSLSKFDGQEMRLLTPNEYLQLTGRAGRRGLDTRGAAIIPYSPWEPFEASFQKITGEILPVMSSFVIRYNSVLSLWRPGDIQHLRRICASSLREYQRYLLWELNELSRLEKRYKKAKKTNGRKKGPGSESALQALEKRREKIGSFPLSRAGAAELDGTVFSLRALGFIGQDDQLTLKGRLLRNIYHPAGITIVEMMMQGILDELSPHELAEVCSWFTFDNDKRLHNRDVVPKRLQKARKELWYVTQHINGIEERAQIASSPATMPEFHGIALAWARNTPLTGLMKRIELAEGDMLMVLNQTIDLMQQVQAAVGQLLDDQQIWSQISPVLLEGKPVEARLRTRELEMEQQRQRLTHLRPLLAQGAASLLHGIIVQSRTVPSMSVQVEGEEVPLDAESDRDAEPLYDPEVFAEDL